MLPKLISGEFFLETLQMQARANESRARKILSLYQTKKDWFVDLTHSQHAIRALDWFFSKPVFKTSDFVATVGIPKPTASRIVKLAKEHDLLRELETGSGRRPAVLAFAGLLNIAEGRIVF